MCWSVKKLLYLPFLFNFVLCVFQENVCLFVINFFFKYVKKPNRSNAILDNAALSKIGGTLCHHHRHPINEHAPHVKK